VNSSALIAVELVFVLGAALTWGCWELYCLKRDKGRDQETAKGSAASGSERAPPDPPK